MADQLPQASPRLERRSADAFGDLQVLAPRSQNQIPRDVSDMMEPRPTMFARLRKPAGFTKENIPGGRRKRQTRKTRKTSKKTLRRRR